MRTNMRQHGAGVSRAYTGCCGLDLLVDQDDPGHIVVWERWESRRQYEEYLEWRDTSGTVAEIEPLLAGSPSIHYYEVAQSYP
ncbi:MAG: antibiotic biosynthesis monooxygenase [Gammaproteobacteria bacterium]|nr:antibiotic biosynthesis monooxygenase [Gammaproteobacteria bacterium]